MTDQTPAQTKRQSPSEQFRTRVEAMAESYISQIAAPNKVAQAAGRLGLALRAAAVGNPEIYGCTTESVARAVAHSAILDLMPGAKGSPEATCYVIPRKSKGRLELEWQISVKGWQALAGRAGWLRVVAVPVHVDDHYEVFLGSEERIDHRPCGRAPTRLEDLRAMYVSAAHRDGYRVAVPVSLDIIEARAQKDAYSSSPWAKWPIEMAQKTAIGYVIRRGYLGVVTDAQAATFDSGPELGTDAHVESAPARQATRPAAIEYDSEEVLEALPEVEEVDHD